MLALPVLAVVPLMQSDDGPRARDAGGRLVMSVGLGSTVHRLSGRAGLHVRALSS